MLLALGISIVSTIGAMPVLAQPGLEDTELVGWTTTVSGLLDRTVSGATESTGGAPGSHYLVRHEHEHFQSFSSSVVSASFAPTGHDPTSIGLDRTVRISVDYRNDYDIPGFLAFSPYTFWTPVLEQRGVVYRQTGVGVRVDSVGTFQRVEVETPSSAWRAGSSDPPIELGLGAPPVRVGFVIQSELAVAQGQRGEARIRVDNLRIEQTDPLPVARLVGMPSADGDHVIFAPPECFDGLSDVFSNEFEVEVELHRAPESELCVQWRLPRLELVEFCPSTGPRPPGLLFPPGARTRSHTFRCSAEPLSTIELQPAPGYTVGVPASVRPVPCRLRVGDELQECSVVTGLCAVEVVFDRICQLGHDLYCDDVGEAVRSGRVSEAVSATGARPLDTLRRVRDEVMSETPAGRYYRDLYAAFSPELRSLILGDLRFTVDLFDAIPTWGSALEALVDGDGDNVTLTPEMVADMLAIFDRFEEKASAPLEAVFQRERNRLDLADLAGSSIEDAVALVEQRGGPPTCSNAQTSLCLQNGRFQVEVVWTDFKGVSGTGRAVPLSSDSGYFWFFDQDNVELVLKVLDGQGINERFWVFYGALSNVDYTVLVTDTETGALRAYRNPSGTFASVGDVDAFAPDGSARSGVEVAAGDESSWAERLSTAASDLLRSGWRRLRDRFSRAPAPAAAAQPLRHPASSPVTTTTTASGTCVQSATALCLAGNRFRVEVSWRDFSGGSGFGQAAPLTADTGTFWFFDPANTELIVKVLDGQDINGHFWVFFGALSNVEYTLRVTDTATGRVRTYDNPSGSFASRGDVEAF